MGVFAPGELALEGCKLIFQIPLLHLSTREAVIQKVVFQMNVQKILCSIFTPL